MKDRESTIQDVTLSETRQTYESCTEREQAFIDNIVHKRMGRVEAYLEAGYSETNAKAYSRKIFWRVRPVIESELEQKFQTAAPMAMTVLVDLLTSKSEQVRLRAAQDILNRTGWSEVKKVEVKDTSQKSDKEIDSELRNILGIAQTEAIKVLN